MSNKLNHSDYLAKLQYFEDRLRKQDSKNIARNERQYASQLNMAGREAYFKECFYGIKLEDQQLPKIGPFENIIETHNFNEGYKRGKFLVDNNIVPEEYQQFINNSKKHR